MRRSILLSFLLAWIVVPFLCVPASAEPTIRGSWLFSCGPSVLDTSLSGASERRLVFSQGGADSLARRYRLALEISAPGAAAFPDAWRFDAPGCQGPFQLDFATHLPTPIRHCPENIPYSSYSIGYSVAMVDPGNVLRIEFNRDYASPGAIPGTIERFLLGLGFFHFTSVTGISPDTEHCGGAETAMCIRLVESTYETFSGEVRAHVRQNATYTVNAAAGSGDCGPVPARAETWGNIKAQHR